MTHRFHGHCLRAVAVFMRPHVHARGVHCRPMADPIDVLEQEAVAALEAAGDPAALEAWRIEFLGSKGRLKAMMSTMRDLSPEERPVFGERMNGVKEALQVWVRLRMEEEEEASAAGEAAAWKKCDKKFF